MIRSTTLVAVLLALGISAHAETEPSDLAAARAKQLEDGITAFRLDLLHYGNQDKPYYRLNLGVPPAEHLRGDHPFHRFVRISEEQAQKIVAHLVESGFLDRAKDFEAIHPDRAPVGPRYILNIRAEAIIFQEDLGWGLPMVKRLEGLRKVLDGDAAKAMDLLLGRLSGLRRQFALTVPATDTAQSEERNPIANVPEESKALRPAGTFQRVEDPWYPYPDSPAMPLVHKLQVPLDVDREIAIAARVGTRDLRELWNKPPKQIFDAPFSLKPPQFGDPVYAVLLGPTLNSSERMRLREIEWIDHQAVLRVELWRDSAMRKRNTPYLPLLVAPLQWGDDRLEPGDYQVEVQWSLFYSADLKQGRYTCYGPLAAADAALPEPIKQSFLIHAKSASQARFTISEREESDVSEQANDPTATRKQLLEQDPNSFQLTLKSFRRDDTPAGFMWLEVIQQWPPPQSGAQTSHYLENEHISRLIGALAREGYLREAQGGEPKTGGDAGWVLRISNSKFAQFQIFQDDQRAEATRLALLKLIAETKTPMQNAGGTAGGKPRNQPTTPKRAVDTDVYEKFNDFSRRHFGAEKEPLLYKKFGKELASIKDGAWSHVSENSAVIAWETNLPATSHIEYGETHSYGMTTHKEERPFSLHVHYLRGLKTGKTYHYRLVSVDERGNRLMSEDRRITPQQVDGAMYVPGDVKGPPYTLDKPGTYVLTADIDADVTGIDITASNVVLDLNGHTITYDTSTDAYEKMKETAAFTTGFGSRPTGGPHGVRGSYASREGVRVFNGFIRQGPGGHDWWSGPVSAQDWEEVAGVTAIWHGPQVRGIEGSVANLHHNVLLDRGTEIPNRHQGTCAIQRGHNAHHNLIKRSRHRGVDAVNGGKVYRNEIYIDSFATNSYGVFHYKTREAICNENRIFGTGYHFIGVGTASSGVGEIKILGNFIHGRTLESVEERWSEYGDQSGVNGLRAYRGEDIEWSGNVVVVEGRGSAKGEVRGAWFMPHPSQRNLIYHNNIFKAVADPDKKTALGAVVISAGKDPKHDYHGLFRDNLIISDFCNVSLGGEYYGDGTNGRFVGNTLVRVGRREDYRTIQCGVEFGEHSSGGHVFVDSQFEDGAAYDKVRWRGDGDFDVGWTITINAVPEARIKIHNKLGELVHSLPTRKSGGVNAVLMQYRHADTGKTMLTPHTLTLEKKGKDVLEKSISINGPMEATLRPDGDAP